MDTFRKLLRPALIPLNVVAALAGGCSTDFWARSMIEHVPVTGKVRLATLPSTETLLERGKIDRHLRLTMPDDVELDVWFVRARRRGESSASRQPRGTALLLHGLLDSKGRVFGLSQQLADRGYDVVLYDHRAHGDSGGRYVTFGALEHRDAKLVMDQLIERGIVTDAPVYVFGISMGAATAIQYAASDPRCRGAMLVAGFSDMRPAIRRYVPWLSDRAFEAALARAGEIAGFDPNVPTPEQCAAAFDGPMLIVHGRLDGIVPYSHGKALHQAASDPKELITVGWAGHLGILVGRDRWFAEHFNRMARGELGRCPKER
jgi:pimeloyl-ACP methyl ester carboxylesterase